MTLLQAVLLASSFAFYIGFMSAALNRPRLTPPPRIVRGSYSIWDTYYRRYVNVPVYAPDIEAWADFILTWFAILGTIGFIIFFITRFLWIIPLLSGQQ